MSQNSHYPGYDAMREEAAWDDHTREVVRKRLGGFEHLEFLTEPEAAVLTQVVATLVDDSSAMPIEFAVRHIDSREKSRIGESQRKVGVPAEPELIRKGLAAIEAESRATLGGAFADQAPGNCAALLGRLERSEFSGAGRWQGIPQKELFTKLLTLAVETYYSHPQVWSEIGYGGPAYPRGYVRTELDLTDPWEPKRPD